MEGMWHYQCTPHGSRAVPEIPAQEDHQELLAIVDKMEGRETLAQKDPKEAG